MIVRYLTFPQKQEAILLKTQWLKPVSTPWAAMTLSQDCQEALSQTSLLWFQQEHHTLIALTLKLLLCTVWLTLSHGQKWAHTSHHQKAILCSRMTYNHLSTLETQFKVTLVIVGFWVLLLPWLQAPNAFGPCLIRKKWMQLVLILFACTTWEFPFQ